MQLGTRKDVTRKVMSVCSYIIVGMKRGSKGGKGGWMYDEVHQGQGDRGEVGTHLAHGYHSEPQECILYH